MGQLRATARRPEHTGMSAWRHHREVADAPAGGGEEEEQQQGARRPPRRGDGPREARKTGGGRSDGNCYQFLGQRGSSSREHF